MINTKRLRLVIGVLGMCLPIIVLVLSLVYTGVFPDSISATWYLSQCVTPFMIILGAASFLLVGYMGYDSHDDLICSLAGIFGLLICLFPCNTEDLSLHWAFIIENVPVGTFQMMPNISGLVHNISAVGFFGLLSYNSLCLFTKSSGNMTAEKKKRNMVYKVCGIGMLASLVLIIPIAVLEVFDITLWGAVWGIETVALFFFGVSWLTKAECVPFLFVDKKQI